MLRAAATAFWLFALAVPSAGQSVNLDAIVDRHIIAGFQAFSTAAEALRNASEGSCEPDSKHLVAAYHDAFDAWIRVSHLRFGPAETDGRAFALAFWPDARGATPKALAGLISAEDPVIHSPDEFATVSVAARGFYALEFLLFDPRLSAMEPEDYRCALVQAIATDIGLIASAILEDWVDGYASLLRQPGQDSAYRTEEEAAQEVFKALSTGLQFTSEARLGRPLGTFERPRPRRAEVKRSGRTLRHIVLSLAGTENLAVLLSESRESVAAPLAAAYDRAYGIAENLDDPILEGVADPQRRIRIEALKNAVDSIRRIVAENLGPSLGVAAGFNSLDGD